MIDKKRSLKWLAMAYKRTNQMKKLIKDPVMGKEDFRSFLNGQRHELRIVKKTIEEEPEGIREGDVFIINKDDDEWYDVVVRRDLGLELSQFHNPVTDIDLKCAVEADNCVVIGNIHKNPKLKKKVGR